MNFPTRWLRLLALIVLPWPVAPAAAAEESGPLLWPEAQRAFFQDGPGLLLSRDERERLAGLPEAERREFIDRFLADPIAETPDNELVEGIRRRQTLALAEQLSFSDDRVALLFLHGAPAQVSEIDCGQTFVPLQIWSYPRASGDRQLVLYRPKSGGPYRLWLPMDSKRALYQRDMGYWLQQWEEFRGRLGKRFDLQACPRAREVDKATGIEALSGFQEQRPGNQELLAWLRPPDDLAAWARAAAATPLPDLPLSLELSQVQVLFPDRIQQRIVSRFLLTVPPETRLEPVVADDLEELRLSLEGVVEQDGAVFEEFRVRYKLPPREEGRPLALVFERALRPQREFLVRFRLSDEGSGRETVVGRGFRVPAEAQRVEEPPVPEEVIVAMGEELALQPIAGKDSLLLAPPDSDVVLGVWRAEALVTGEAIQRVVFLVDGERQLVKTQPPFTAEVRLAQFPREQVIRAEGYDADGELVAADEVVVNRPRGAFRVRIEEPQRGARLSGRITARAEVWVPEDRRVEEVVFRLNDQTLGTLTQPPWQLPLEVPAAGETAFLTVVATLDDGRSTEEVRYLNAPQYLEEVDIQLVELLTTVVDNSRRPVAGLGAEQFQVFEDGRRQELSRFERVEDLPLTVGITIDTSGSMVDSLLEAKKAAVGFLDTVLEPQDKAFAVSFAKEPILLVPPTDDLGAIEDSLEDLQSIGWTALHDAVVSSLYYFRAFRGQRALILLSDGDDSASYYPFRDALEYARRSGVVIYTVGLNVGIKVAVRRKLAQLAEETGGRVFFIQRAEELAGVYREIEEELRSQYLLTYASDNTTADDRFRTIEVKVSGGKYTARTLRGYYP